MNEIKISRYVDEWLGNIRDKKAKLKIAGRITRAANGNFGDCKNLGNGLWEMRIDYGPGFRIYYTRKGEIIYFLICGGDKSTQEKDIEFPRQIMEEQNG